MEEVTCESRIGHTQVSTGSRRPPPIAGQERREEGTPGDMGCQALAGDAVGGFQTSRWPARRWCHAENHRGRASRSLMLPRPPTSSYMSAVHGLADPSSPQWSESQPRDVE
jgi:hypothetical protein